MTCVSTMQIRARTSPTSWNDLRTIDRLVGLRDKTRAALHSYSRKDAAFTGAQGVALTRRASLVARALWTVEPNEFRKSEEETWTVTSPVLVGSA